MVAQTKIVDNGLATVHNLEEARRLVSGTLTGRGSLQRLAVSIMTGALDGKTAYLAVCYRSGDGTNEDMKRPKADKEWTITVLSKSLRQYINGVNERRKATAPEGTKADLLPMLSIKIDTETDTVITYTPASRATKGAVNPTASGQAAGESGDSPDVAKAAATANPEQRAKLLSDATADVCARIKGLIGLTKPSELDAVVKSLCLAVESASKFNLTCKEVVLHSGETAVKPAKGKKAIHKSTPAPDATPAEPLAQAA